MIKGNHKYAVIILEQLHYLYWQWQYFYNSYWISDVYKRKILIWLQSGPLADCSRAASFQNISHLRRAVGPNADSGDLQLSRQVQRTQVEGLSQLMAPKFTVSLPYKLFEKYPHSYFYCCTRDYSLENAVAYICKALHLRRLSLHAGTVIARP